MITGSILMLEYDEDDRYLTQQYLENQYPGLQVEMVTTSSEFIDHLKQSSKKKLTLPSLFLLNYDSTPMNAVELIGELKKSKEYLHIPIVVLSGVVTPLSVKDCYAAGATSFIKKPASVVETNNKISAFIKYWFETVELPK